MAQENQTNETLLIFRVGRIPCAVPALSMDGIAMPPSRITATPGADRTNPGLFVHGTETAALVDLREKFGLSGEARASVGRILRSRLAGKPYGFWVDEVVAIAEDAQGQRLPLPPDLPHGVFHSAFLYRGELVLCTDFARLYVMNNAGPLRRYQASLEAAARQAEEQRRAAEKPPAPAKPAAPRPLPQRPVRPPEPKESLQASPQGADPARPKAPREKHPGADAPSAHPRHQERTAPETRGSDEGPLAPVKAKTPAPAAATERRRPPPPKAITKAAPAAQTPKFNGGAAGPAPSRPLHPSPPPSPSPKTPPPIPVDDTREDGPWTAILLVLGALVFLALPAWWFLGPSTQPAAKPIPETAMAPPPAETSQAADETEYTPPSRVQETAHEDEAGHPVTPPPQTPEPHPSASLQVERDAQGITLFVQGASPREGLAEAETPVPPAPELSSADEAASRPLPAEPEQAPDDAPTPPDSAPPPPHPRVFIHTVVPGDTLWAIAEHYINNPWKYPELARQSGIHNPDLIYPGDKVRIVFR